MADENMLLPPTVALPGPIRPTPEGAVANTLPNESERLRKPEAIDPRDPTLGLREWPITEPGRDGKMSAGPTMGELMLTAAAATVVEGMDIRESPGRTSLLGAGGCLGIAPRGA